jgi:methylglyoxal synthase
MQADYLDQILGKLWKHPYEPDIQMLLRICDFHNVPLATNYPSAKRLIKIF